MTRIEKILKEAKEKGIKIAPEIRKGLSAVQKQYSLIKNCKESPYKLYEQLHHPSKK